MKNEVLEETTSELSMKNEILDEITTEFKN